jgi:cobalt-zinc-cadmium efflux system outer membrane protein
MDSFPPSSLRRLVEQSRCLLPAVLLAGCASLDPQGNLDAAASLATSRIDTSAAAAWQQPVDTPSSAWNGRDPLHADVALAVAIQNNPSLRIALSRIAERRADFVQAGLLPNPTVGVGIGVAIDGLSGAPALVQGLQALTWLWTRPDRIAAADEDLQAAVLTAAEHTVTLAARVGVAHAAALAAAQRRTLDAAYLDISQTTLRLIQARHGVGEAALLDVDRAEVDVQSARTELIAATRHTEQDKLALLETMGWPGHTIDWQAAEPTAATPPRAGSDLALLELAASQHLELAAQAAMIRRHAAARSLADTKRLPEVRFTFGWQRNFNERKAVMPGAQISIPILDNGAPAIAKAQAQLEQARLAWIVAANRIEYDVRNTASKWRQAAAQTLVTADRLLPAAAAALHRSQSAYSEGVVDLTVLLLAQEQHIAAQRILVDQQLAEATALIELRRAVGGTFESLPAPSLASRENPS